MRYGSGGKNWNVGLSQQGLLAATPKQQWFLRKLTGRDMSGHGLTRDAASDLIDAALEERDQRQAALTTVAEQLFNALFSRAVAEANQAGEKWLAKNPEPKFVVIEPETNQHIGVHAAIGRAWITWPKKGSDFHKWLMENVYDGQKREVRIPHRYADRLEGDLMLACEKAAYSVLKKSGSSIGDIRLMYRCEDEAQAA